MSKGQPLQMAQIRLVSFCCECTQFSNNGMGNRAEEGRRIGNSLRSNKWDGVRFLGPSKPDHVEQVHATPLFRVRYFGMKSGLGTRTNSLLERMSVWKHR